MEEGVTDMTEKKGALMRGPEVCEELGLDRQILEKMAEAGTLNRIRMYERGNWFYYRKEVEGLAKGDSGDSEEKEG